VVHTDRHRGIAPGGHRVGSGLWALGFRLSARLVFALTRTSLKLSQIARTGGRVSLKRAGRGAASEPVESRAKPLR
jgi:hypothetical protein